MFTIGQLLNKSRDELLDLSTRNRLLSIPVGSASARIIQVCDELSEQVFHLLVSEKKSMSFLPGRQARRAGKAAAGEAYENADEVGLPQPDEEQDSSTGLPKRHVDCRLQTALSPEGLQRRLFDLYHDSLTMIEEQGVNILYLVLGHLKWFETDNADTPRYAPLILIPVRLGRKSASERFTLQWTEDDIEENLSLRAKLKRDFNLELPAFPDEELFNVTEYHNRVVKSISGVKNWEVLPNEITLGFFSFAKFLMYRDLDPNHWPTPDQLLKQPFITGLLQDGFPQSEPLLPDDTSLDELIPVSKLDHVVDADGSQTLAIEAVRQGRSMVIQGPPGTGKSQSITNIIATAVLEGKQVLFVAEKLAALEVVKRRLEREGLGAICLELHSNKSNKRAVVEEIGRTWKLGRPKASELESLIPKLEQKRSVLNNHAATLHEKHEPSGLTPFGVIGRLAMLGSRGQQAAELTFDRAESWTPDQQQANRRIIEELVQRIEQIGLPTKHPWRGVCRETVLIIDHEPFFRKIQRAKDSLPGMRETSVALAKQLSQPVPESFADAEEQLVIAEYVARAPKLDKEALCNSVWNAGMEGLRDLIAEGKRFAAAYEVVHAAFVETLWEKDFSNARSHIAAHGQSLLRFLNGNYRAAIAEIRGAMTAPFPKPYADRLALIDCAIAGQRAFRKIRESDPVGKAAFGTLWRQERTDWKQLETILDWVLRQNEAGLGPSFRQMFAGVEDQAAVASLAAELRERLTASREAFQKLFLDLCLDCAMAFGTAEFTTVPLETIAERCGVWLAHPEDLSRWNNYFVRARAARSWGMTSLVDLIETGGALATDATDCFDRVYFSQLFREMVKRKPELAQFDGELHEKHIAEFKQLDRERLALAKYRTLVAHYNRMSALNAGVGAAGIVKGEMERKRGHRTVRRLLKDAGSVVQAIKPVFMMSPLSVAQFLEPGSVAFDLLVIDEASQVQPVDALGAIARCKQIIVVGDSKQLPPTRFFTRLTSDGDSLDDEEIGQPQVAQAQEIESILGLCRARGLPEKMLRWHYRSRHHSLIAVSNHEFYEDKLYIVPSPFLSAGGFGLKFNHVPGGVFDSGVSGTNRVEAKAVCQAIVNHARNNRDQTLGVVAFSVRQRQAILDELELLRRENPDTEGFFSGHPAEPFFIKNLENVQGDERDVIFISVGYGRDVHGCVSMRFGPLGAEGGERRLNVLISRARKQCEIFSSITADDIDLNRATGRGVAALKTFLSFAETGRLSVGVRSDREEESPFEEAVRRAIESLGYEVHPQVGIAGFFIDLAVLDREQKGRYLLGIECDGATYHSSHSARDRDRLRQAVLEDHGWIIHRIWSTDWFQRPGEQLRKLTTAIEQAKTMFDETCRPSLATPTPTPFAGADDLIEREAISESMNKSLAGLATPYQQAQFDVPSHVEPHLLAAGELAGIVQKIVEIEGPVHEDEVISRVRHLWGFSRAGARIQDAVAKSVRSLLVTKRCSREDGFLVLPGASIPIRNRELVSSPELRKPDMIPLVELRAGILALIDASHGAAKQEIPIAIARMLGFKNTSAQLRSLIESQIAGLARQGLIVETNGMFKRAPAKES